VFNSGHDGHDGEGYDDNFKGIRSRVSMRFPSIPRSVACVGPRCDVGWILSSTSGIERCSGATTMGTFFKTIAGVSRPAAVFSEEMTPKIGQELDALSVVVDGKFKSGVIWVDDALEPRSLRPLGERDVGFWLEA
jgi:hypothetical protein